MAVPQEPLLNGNENTTQTRQNSSPKATRTRQLNGSPTQPQDEGYYLRVSITTLDKNRRDPVFKFKAITNLPRYRNSSYPLVERSYIEFERLYNALTYSNPECIVPALPFSSSSYQATEDDERRVKHSMQQWVNRVAINPVLCHDEELRSFIETDFAFIPATKPRKRTSSFRLKFSSDIRDEDKALTHAKSVAHSLEGHFLDTAKASQKLAGYRKGLATFNTDLGTKSIAMGTIEKHPPLSNGLRKFGKTLQIISERQKLQAISEAAALGDFFSYYAINSHVVKETLANRLRIISEHDDAVKTTISKRRYIERLKSSTNIKSDKVTEALEDLEYAKSYEQNLDARVKRVTKNLHNELKIYEKNRAQDFFNAVKEYVKKQILFEKQQLKEWENLRPDIKAITKRNMHIYAFEDEKLDAKAIAERLSSTYM
ncbi:Vps5 C terminal like-domain-containing protein [Glomus cerebriforme]|uniref:Vps5 C terminal like-domain-containing protein n=1 Tax=Glomus cerebriforme TaxID=658196 RepID=A0A397TF93_9GLOM|nr:Vps5 C terminal like-domain-containing protein [Glomus cerebriforme]